MIPTCYIAPGEKTSPIWCRAFANGSGATLRLGGPLQPGPVALFGSPALWTVVMEAQLQGRQVDYGDHAYFGRGRYYRITRNGYQVDGRTPTLSMAQARQRFEVFRRPVRPWRTSGGHVLICPQSATYFRLFGMDVEAWIVEVSRLIQGATDRDIRVRWKTDVAQKPIEQDLRDCWAVVAFSSAAALDALIAGVPVFTLASFAATSRMGSRDVTQIETPYYPDDREEFLAVLASHQWTLAEMRTGMAWRALEGRS